MTEEVVRNEMIKVVSFNLRRDFSLFKKYRWDKRREAAAEFIRNSGACIIGVQEMMPAMKDDLQKLLDRYSVLGWGRFYGKKENDDEHSDLILNNDDVEVNFCKTFWLSKNPDLPSRAYFAVFPRICTVAEVTLKKMNKRIRVFNTHFDHICGLARVLGVRIIMDYMNRLNENEPLPTILMGDLNAKPGSRPIQMLRENPWKYPNIHLNDVYLKSRTPLCNTHHGFKGKVKWTHQPIDYIFVSDDFEVANVEICTKNRNGVYPSDHYPIIATLALRETPQAYAT